MRVDRKRATGQFESFSVARSEKTGSGSISVVPPDLALCVDCTREMLDPADRRYLYPFITCINCGPRFTLIEELPYDRLRTSMETFQLCTDCEREYGDLMDRRYHAEPTCCPRCGPRMELYGSHGEPLETSNPPLEAARLLDEGQMVAIKGIGGIHVATKTTEDGVLERLRKNFDRPQQPLAVMSRDLETVRTFAEVSEAEAELLSSYRRPIIVLEHSSDYPLSELVAPGLDSVGVMLPYSGIHHLILRYGKDPAYVMTSANVHGLPMLTESGEALAELEGLVDYLLLHNRTIVNRCDDSVVKLVDGSPALLRRSRGYAPEPIGLSFESERKVLALGPELNDTVAILLGDRCFVSQHLGDMTKVETLEYMRASAQSLMHLLGLDRVDVIAHDLHPAYTTTRIAPSIAGGLGASTFAVQHHHAHLASLMAERGLDRLVGIAADGVGYGPDGTAWGGEVMVADFCSYKRVGGLANQPMPGGDLAARYPARMVAGILWEAIGREELEKVLIENCMNGFKHGEREIGVVLRQLERGLNVFRTSSCGRVLDAAASMLGICNERTYEGEPAIKLEAAAKGNGVVFEPRLKREGDLIVFDTSRLLLDALETLREGKPRSHIAAAFQRALARGLAEVAIGAANEFGIRTIGASGGVFYNRAMTAEVRRSVEGKGLKFVRHRLLPTGDGGIAVGQAVVAAQAP